MRAARDIGIFILGFLTRAMIAYISDRTYAWRVERAMRKYDRQERIKHVTMWTVKLRGIDWDDGDGEYDVSDLPHDLDITVAAFSADDALDAAMDEASESYGSLINGVKHSELEARRSH